MGPSMPLTKGVRGGQDLVCGALSRLEAHPLVGRPVVDEDPDTTGLRELIMPFGDSGYVALYTVTAETVVVLAIRRQRQAGW